MTKFEIRQKVVALRNQGYKKREISQILGISINKAHELIRGIPRQKSETEKQIELLRVAGLTNKEIAASLGLTTGKVKYLTSQWKLPKPNIRRYKDLTGKRFHSWLVLSLVDDSNPQAIKWMCRCLDCNREKIVSHASLVKQYTHRCASCAQIARRKAEANGHQQEVTA